MIRDGHDSSDLSTYEQKIKFQTALENEELDLEESKKFLEKKRRNFDELISGDVKSTISHGD